MKPVVNEDKDDSDIVAIPAVPVCVVVGTAAVRVVVTNVGELDTIFEPQDIALKVFVSTTNTVDGVDGPVEQVGAVVPSVV